MARGVEFKLAPAGIAEIATSSDMAATVHGAAEAVSAAISNEFDVYLEDYVSDRAGTTVTISADNATGVESKYGVLSSAASAAGLQYVGR